VLTVVVVAGSTAYALATWEQPHRSLILILLGAALVGGLGLILVPTERILAGRWREPFFIAWSALDIALIAALVAADGGTGSPYRVLFALTLVFASLSYPLPSFLVVGALNLLGYILVGAAAGGQSFTAGAFAVFGLSSIALLCAWQAHNQDRQRRELTEVAEALQESERSAALILETAYEAYVAMDERGEITGWNARAEAMFGWTREEVAGRSLADTIVPAPHRDAHRRGLERFLATGEGPLLGKRIEVDGLHRDGHEFPIELAISPVRAGNRTTFHAFCEDISQRRRAEESLRESEERFRTLVQGVKDYAIFALGVDGRIESWNEGAERIYGYSADQILGEHFSRFLPPDEGGDRAAERALEHAAGGGPVEEEGWRLRADGARFWADVTLSPLFARSGKLRGFVKVTRDITERRRAQEALREAEERFRSAFEAAPVGIALVDTSPERTGRFIQVNGELSSITGFATEKLLETSLQAITHPEDMQSALDLLGSLLDAGVRSRSIEVRCFRAEGEVVWVSLSASLVRGAEGDPLYAIVQVQDVSERKRFEGQLQYLADHDPLTGLFNRRRFGQELRREIAFSERSGAGGAVLVIDLDNFKYVNDTLGHAVGDELIIQVGSLVKGRLRNTDIVARLGGDEFAAVLPATPSEDALEVAGGLLDEIRNSQSALAGGGRTHLTASVGVSTFGPELKVPADSVLVNADIAMYEAKEAGRDRVELLDAEGPTKTQMRARLTWSERIRDALEEDRFTLFQQPILDLQTNKIERHELLLRLLGEDDDLIPPGTFLYIAEQFGLIQAIDRWVCGKAFALLDERQKAGENITLEVNLSGASITDPALTDFVESEVRASGIDPTGLVFEVTETAAIVNIDKARQFAGRMAALGCSFALDDFGAGFGSFYYLKHLPFDYLKIDGDFITKLPTSLPDQLTVKAIVQIAQGMGKRTIAEFVGDERTVELLRGYGVDFAQGYHVGPPVPIEQTWQRVDQRA
jgi:diguanylate cyclase (GGDEF)-like protein/PAS domain S-box-containing protein